MIVEFPTVRPPLQRSIGARDVLPSRSLPLFDSSCLMGCGRWQLDRLVDVEPTAGLGTGLSRAPRDARQSLEADHPPDSAPEHRRQPCAHRAVERIWKDAADHWRGRNRVAGEAGKIKEGSAHAVTFGGNPTIVIPPGAPAISDPVDMSADPLALVSVSLYLPEVTPLSTIHWDGHQTAYVGAGNQVTNVDFKADFKMTQRAFLSEILVDAPAGARAVVAFGDSITDGDGSTVDGNDRWPDRLAERLAKVGGPPARGLERGHIRREDFLRPDGNQCAGALRHRRPQSAQGRHGHC